MRRAGDEVRAKRAGSPAIVLFDLDNTLVHSRIDFLGIRHAIIARMLDAGALEAPPANPREHSIPEWLDMATAFDSALAAELWAVVDQFEQDGMVHGSVEADARSTLDALSERGHRLAVLTNNSLLSAEAALERFDLRAPLDLVLARGTVPALKPRGDGVAQAHRDLGGGPTVLVGDAYIDGLATQRAGVGARFIAFRANPEEFSRRGVDVWAHLDRLGALPALLDLTWSDAVPGL